MESWQDLASRSRASARKSDEDAARFHERVGDEVVRRFWLLAYSALLRIALHCIILHYVHLDYNTSCVVLFVLFDLKYR